MHQHHIGNGVTVYFYIRSIAPQACSAAVGTNRAAFVTRQHYTILNFVEVPFEHFEKGIQPVKFTVSCPKQLFLLVAEFVVRFVNRKIKFPGHIEKILQPFTHFFTFPWSHGAFVN
ncbi:hypothetical protein SDC9_59135 [bioreactor metagenome]|uniref:Uncharacterized protein n=1 Tax=bioreactor metagenome TaxID=1076179 RepID=A0A644XAL0_9ZZZZ